VLDLWFCPISSNTPCKVNLVLVGVSLFLFVFVFIEFLPSLGEDSRALSSLSYLVLSWRWPLARGETHDWLCCQLMGAKASNRGPPQSRDQTVESTFFSSASCLLSIDILLFSNVVVAPDSSSILVAVVSHSACRAILYHLILFSRLSNVRVLGFCASYLCLASSRAANCQPLSSRKSYAVVFFLCVGKLST